MDKYFKWIHYEQLHNHNKAKHNKTVCIFLGKYCIPKQPNVKIDSSSAWSDTGLPFQYFKVCQSSPEEFKKWDLASHQLLENGSYLKNWASEPMLTSFYYSNMGYWNPTALGKWDAGLKTGVNNSDIFVSMLVCMKYYLNQEGFIIISLVPGRFERNLRKVIFKLILMIGGRGIFCKMALKWMWMDLTDDKSSLVQVMAWCPQATSHYLSQCWPRSMSPYGHNESMSCGLMSIIKFCLNFTYI